MEKLNSQDLFTIDEVAKWCGLTRNAAYMHYRRGHLIPVQLLCHRLYFTRAEIDAFREKYCPYTAGGVSLF